jgi:NAD(P)-dependent dehydrogenase (short-subunit alcohol dehydrogenase family)
MSTELQGKICLITGGTNGLGKSTALSLAKMGATVVIVGRDELKSVQVVEELRTASGNNNVHSLTADLSSQADVRRLAGEFKAKYSKLHVLINNAGAAFTQRQLSADGVEMTLALNHLAGFLLTNLLLDTLKASAPARIINVSSGGHTAGRIEFDNLQGEKKYGFDAYLNSKLANILFTVELAGRLAGTQVTVNALDPGLTATGFGTNNGKVMATLIKVFAPLVMRSPEKGAETSVYLASSPAVATVTGKYFRDSKAVPPASQADDAAVAKELWEVSAKLVNLAA